MPEAAERSPRLDENAADMRSLVALGRAPAQPTPGPPPERGPAPAEQANEAALQTALAEAGVAKTGGDEQVIDTLAKLDPAQVEAITRWLKAGKGKPETGGAK